MSLRRFLKRVPKVHTSSTVCTPELNGPSENQNCKLLDEMRFPLSEASPYHRFWGEEALYSAHLSNVTWHELLIRSALFSILFNEGSRCLGVSCFGCQAHRHVPREARKKKLGSRFK